MRHTFLLTAGLIAVAMLTAGCEEGAGGSKAEADASLIEQRVAHKSSVQYGTLDELLDNEVECNGQSDQRCVEICHRPPGNPENGKTKVLPIKALTAHLNHGADHHHDHDYLGPCEEDTSDDDPIIIVDDPEGGSDGASDGAGDDGGADDGSGDEGSNDGYGVDVPTWCEPFYDIDQDCDGYEDGGFTPTF